MARRVLRTDEQGRTLIAPVHPGEILREDFMKPLGLSVNKLALLGVVEG